MGNLKKYLKTKKLKKDITLGFKKTINILNPQIEQIDAVFQSMQSKYNTKELPLIINNFLFFKITFRDILTSMNQLQNLTDQDEINLTTRSLALHLYDF